jgi:hypothetical protein
MNGADIGSTMKLRPEPVPAVAAAAALQTAACYGGQKAAPEMTCQSAFSG